jgi:hypothetical protein
MAFEAELPLIIGIIGVAFAILERGYKAYLDQKKVDPSIKFGGSYMLNLLISTSVGTAVVTTVIPTLVTQLTGSTEVPLTVGALFLNFVLGYTITYRILDALNTSTDRKLEVAAVTPAPTPAKA